MLHAILRWPDETKTDLWPMLVQHASYLHIVIPRMDCGFSLTEFLSVTISDHKSLSKIPVWRCPTYVPHPALQSKRKIPKWQPRSRCAQFMKWSSMYASNVALVNHLSTNYISPQFHVIFDNRFETILAEKSLEEVPELDVIFTQNQHGLSLDSFDLEGFELHEDSLTKEEILENWASKNNTSTIKSDKEQRLLERWYYAHFQLSSEGGNSSFSEENITKPDGDITNPKGASSKETITKPHKGILQTHQ